MPLKITSNQVSIRGREISFGTITQLVQNFVDITYKKFGAADPVKVTPNNDAHAVHYTKQEVDDLFAANGYDPATSDPKRFGLRIYLGLHQHTPPEDREMPDRPEEYINQHTVILVSTFDRVDLLDPGNFVSILTNTPGHGVEEGQLCPPPACGAVDGGLH